MNKSMTGLSSSVAVKGAEKMKWEFRDNFRVSQTILVDTYYVPYKSVRLMSPQSYFK